MPRDGAVNNENFVTPKTLAGRSPRVERRRVTLTLTGSSANASGWYYQDFVTVNFLTPFSAPPLFELTAVIAWGAVQTVQVFEVTATSFKVRGMRLGVAVAACEATYVATEV